MANVNETPSLAQVIKDAIEARICELHVSLPGRIVTYDASTQKAKVQLQIRRRYVDGKEVDIPPVVDVPVAWPRAGKAYLHMPLRAGDQVMVVFSERSLDEWKQRGGSVSPANNRKHSYSDAWAVPGGYPFINVVGGSSSDVTLVNDKTEFRLTPSGKMSLQGSGGEELLKILDDFLEVAGRATTNTIFGPMKWNEHPEIIAIRQRLGKIKL